MNFDRSCRSIATPLQRGLLVQVPPPLPVDCVPWTLRDACRRLLPARERSLRDPGVLAAAKPTPAPAGAARVIRRVEDHARAPGPRYRSASSVMSSDCGVPLAKTFTSWTTTATRP